MSHLTAIGQSLSANHCLSFGRLDHCSMSESENHNLKKNLSVLYSTSMILIGCVGPPGGGAVLYIKYAVLCIILLFLLTLSLKVTTNH